MYCFLPNKQHISKSQHELFHIISRCFGCPTSSVTNSVGHKKLVSGSFSFPSGSHRQFVLAFLCAMAEAFGGDTKSRVNMWEALRHGCFFAYLGGCKNPGSEWNKKHIHFYEGKPFLIFTVFQWVPLCSGTGEARLLTMQSLPSLSSLAGRSRHDSRAFTWNSLMHGWDWDFSWGSARYEKRKNDTNWKRKKTMWKYRDKLDTIGMWRWHWERLKTVYTSVDSVSVFERPGVLPRMALRETPQFFFKNSLDRTRCCTMKVCWNLWSAAALQVFVFSFLSSARLARSQSTSSTHFARPKTKRCPDGPVSNISRLALPFPVQKNRSPRFLLRIRSS